jgi:hypothetical protein
LPIVGIQVYAKYLIVSIIQWLCHTGTGENKIYGEYLPVAEGEDVQTGFHSAQALCKNIYKHLKVYMTTKYIISRHEYSETSNFSQTFRMDQEFRSSLQRLHRSMVQNN